MKFKIKCEICGCTTWVRGTEDSSVNAVDLDDSDEWEEACMHMLQGNEVSIVDSEYIEFDYD